MSKSVDTGVKMDSVIQYNEYYIHRGVIKAPDDFTTYWAEVWYKEKPLYRWYGTSAYQLAVEWVERTNEEYNRTNSEEQALA